MAGGSRVEKGKFQMSNSLLHTRCKTKNDHSVAETNPDSAYPHRPIEERRGDPVRLDLDESGNFAAVPDVHLRLTRPGIPAELLVVIPSSSQNFLIERPCPYLWYCRSTAA